MRRHCPQCGEPLNDGVCGSCGYGRAKTDGTRDPLRGTCEHLDRGQRCNGAGPYSGSTTGSGPWYCAKHFPLFKGWNLSGARAPPRQGFDDLRGLTKPVRQAFRKIDYEAELERAAIQQEAMP